VTFGYPEVPTREDAEMFKRYFLSLNAVLPCDSCRKNYKKNLEELPIDKYLGSRRDLVKWGYLLHEKVNDELNVPKDRRLTFEEVWNHYESMRSTGCGTSNTCFDPLTKKKCKVQYIVDDKEEFTNTCKSTWPFVVAIVILIIIIILMLLSRIKIRK
jgi:hypothetical protein